MLLGADILLAIICTFCVFGKEWHKGQRSRKKPGENINKARQKSQRHKKMCEFLALRAGRTKSV